MGGQRGRQVGREIRGVSRAGFSSLSFFLLPCSLILFYPLPLVHFPSSFFISVSNASSLFVCLFIFFLFASSISLHLFLYRPLFNLLLSHFLYYSPQYFPLSFHLSLTPIANMNEFPSILSSLPFVPILLFLLLRSINISFLSVQSARLYTGSPAIHPSPHLGRSSPLLPAFPLDWARLHYLISWLRSRMSSVCSLFGLDVWVSDDRHLPRHTSNAPSIIATICFSFFADPTTLARWLGFLRLPV